jgi:hypothetical protein
MKHNELLAPGICILCEMANEGETFYDTGRNFDPGIGTYLSGRKYVCSGCFNTIAAEWGYEASNQQEEAQLVIERVQAELKDLYTTMDANRDSIMVTWREVSSDVTRPRGRPRKNVPA